MDIHKLMVIVKDRDRTSDIAHIEEDATNEKIFITYSNDINKPYPHNKENVVILQKPKNIQLEKQIICDGDMPIYKANT